MNYIYVFFLTLNPSKEIRIKINHYMYEMQ